MTLLPVPYKVAEWQSSSAMAYIWLSDFSSGDWLRRKMYNIVSSGCLSL